MFNNFDRFDLSGLDFEDRQKYNQLSDTDQRLFAKAYRLGYRKGQGQGRENGREDGYDEGHQEGYDDGYDEGGYDQSNDMGTYPSDNAF